MDSGGWAVGGPPAVGVFRCVLHASWRVSSTTFFGRFIRPSGVGYLAVSVWVHHQGRGVVTREVSSLEMVCVARFCRMHYRYTTKL